MFLSEKLADMRSMGASRKEISDFTRTFNEGIEKGKNNGEAMQFAEAHFGGEGSGNFNHAGRPGSIGGSGGGGGTLEYKTREEANKDEYSKKMAAQRAYKDYKEAETPEKSKPLREKWEKLNKDCENAAAAKARIASKGWPSTLRAQKDGK